MEDRMVDPTSPRLWMAVAISICLGATNSFAADARPAKIAVAHFDFVDTSGEVQDQTARHEKQLRQFETEMRQRLAQDDDINLVALPCKADRCSLGNPGIDRLKSEARTTKARFLLAGGLHKMSTLIGWAKFVVVDLEKSGRTCDRLLTYRGDTEEAWRRAAKFGAEDVIRYCFH
jgi:hypothetical protein